MSTNGNDVAAAITATAAAVLEPPLLCVTIDCERDKGPGWRVRRPASFAGIHEGIAGRLEPLFRHFGVKPTYLLSPEVMRDDDAATCLARLRGARELGTHLHAEYVGPQLDDDAESAIFQGALPPALERAKLDALTSLFARTFGARPASFRAGRFGLGDASLGILADLGYTVDSSVTPFVDWTGAGPGAPAFRHAPHTPYRPNPRAPASPGAGPLWEIPLTIRPRFGQSLPVVRSLLAPLLGPRLRQRWLRPTWGSARALIRLAREVWAEAGTHQSSNVTRTTRRPAPAVWNVMFHNVEVVAGASPYARTDDQAQAILRRLGEFLAFARAAGARSVGLGDLPELLS